MQQFDDDPRSIPYSQHFYASWIIIELLHRRTADFDAEARGEITFGCDFETPPQAALHHPMSQSLLDF
jgi:hypothetical protein